MINRLIKKDDILNKQINKDLDVDIPAGITNKLEITKYVVLECVNTFETYLRATKGKSLFIFILFIVIDVIHVI